MKKSKDIDVFMEKAGHVHMTLSEKSDMRRELLNLPAHSGFLNFVFYTHRTFASVAMILLVSVGTVGAAEMSLPGDILYPVKVTLNEPVAKVFVRSSESRADFEAILAERRIAELEALAVRGELTLDIKNDVEKKIAENFETSRREIGVSLAVRNKAEIRAFGAVEDESAAAMTTAMAPSEPDSFSTGLVLESAIEEISIQKSVDSSLAIEDDILFKANQILEKLLNRPEVYEKALLLSDTITELVNEGKIKQANLLLKEMTLILRLSEAGEKSQILEAGFELKREIK